MPLVLMHARAHTHGEDTPSGPQLDAAAWPGAGRTSQLQSGASRGSLQLAFWSPAAKCITSAICHPPIRCYGEEGHGQKRQAIAAGAWLVVLRERDSPGCWSQRVSPVAGMPWSSVTPSPTHDEGTGASRAFVNKHPCVQLSAVKICRGRL